MFIRTERLFLRPSWPEDTDELLELMGAEAFVLNVGATALPRTRAELRERLFRRRDRLLPHFCINLRDDNGGTLIGGVGLSRRSDHVELGYWMARGHRGHGYAAEAVRAVLAEARMLGHSRIVAAPFADDESRVLEQSGFKPAAEARRRFSAARLYVAVLADTMFDILGVGPQRTAPAT